VGLADATRTRVEAMSNSHLLSEVELVCDRVTIIDDGQVVAEGWPDELERPRGVEVETGGGTRVYEGAGRKDVPAIVAELVARGEQVFGARVLASTLEEVSLEAVGGRTG
jgi:ABC-2 type transport system ATP-binding protein